MGTIEIKLSEYYNNPQYYPYMPEVVFDALEAAFLDGKDVAEVPEGAFNGMLAAMQHEKE